MAAQGMEAANVFATFSLKTEAWSKSCGKILQDTAKTLKQVAGIAGAMGAMGGIMGAGLGLAFREATKHSPAAQRAFTDLKATASMLSQEIAGALVPIVTKLSGWIKTLTDGFNHLNPGIRSGIVEVAAYGSGAMVAAAGLGKVAQASAGVLEGLNMLRSGGSKVFSSLLSGVMSISLPMIAWAAVIAGIVLSIGALYRAWNDTSTGLKAGVLEVWEWFKDIGGKIGGFFRDLFNGLKGFVENGLMFILDNVASALSGIGTILKGASKLPGMGWLEDIGKGLESMTGDRLMRGLKGAANQVAETVGKVVDGAVDAGKAIGKGLTYAAGGVGDMLRDAKGLLGGLLGGGDHKKRGGPAGPQKTYYGPMSAAGEYSPAVEAAAAHGLAIWDEFNAQAKTWAEAGQEGAIAANKLWAIRWDNEAKFAKEAADKIQGARDSIRQKAIGSTGAGGAMVETAMEGAAAGGPMGAIGAVVLDLVTKSATFMSLIEMVGGFFQEISDVVGTALAPLLPPLAVIFDMVAVLVKSLQPAIQALLAPLAMITPILSLVGLFLEGLAPVLAVAGQIIAALNVPLTLFGLAMEQLFAVLKPVLAGIMWVVKGVANIWNSVVGFVAGVFEKLKGVPIIGKYFGKIGASLRGMQIDVDAMGAAQRDLKDATIDSTLAAADEAAARRTATEATNSFSEALSNIPTGLLINRLRFESQDAVAPRFQPAPSSHQQAVAPAPQISITVNAAPGQSEEAIALAIMRKAEQEQIRRTGTGYSSSDYSLGFL